MKTKLFTFLLLLSWSSGNLWAQEPSELNLSVTRSYYKVADDPYFPFIIDNKGQGLQINLQYAHPLRQRLFIETAISYLQRKAESEPQYFFCGFGSTICRDYYRVGTVVDARKLGFQLGLRYHLIDRGKWDIISAFGTSISYDVRKQQYYTDAPSAITDPYQIDGLARLGIRYNVFSRFRLELNGQARYKFGEADLYYSKWSFGPGLGIGIDI